MKRNHSVPLDAHRQRGAVLVITLIILLALTIMGTSGMRNTTMEEVMAGNLRDFQMSFQGTEAALRAGEEWTNASTVNRVAAQSHTQLTVPRNWDGVTPAPTGIPDLNAIAGAQLAQNPAFHVSPPDLIRPAASIDLNQSELLCRQIFTITGRGAGNTPDAVSILRSLFDPPRAGLINCPNPD